MVHNQHMLETRGADWGDKVRIVGLSIDGDINALKDHIEAKKWQKVEHYHVRNGVCQADKEHNVKGVPHVILVDTHGVIVFKGHPASRKLEEDIDTLLKGEKITGNGTAASVANGEEEKAGGSHISEVEIAAAKDMFKKQG